jgi:hypothetical protein
VKVKSSNLLNTRLRFHINAVAMKLYMTRDLKVVFLLADKRVVGIGEIEAFVGIDTKVGNRSKRGE